MSEVTVNKEHKDRLFNYIFGSEENREWTLSLYNAVNGSHYTDASLIEFNTLKEVLYLSMRNDTSFTISGILYLYEHQSSFNPNMPLRVMGYLDKLYSGYIKQNGFNRFGKTLIPLPVPKFVVFYNGEDEKEDETILYLSDSFDEEKRAEADIEIKVRMLNVNYGRNREILKACKPLEEYAWCINKIREKNREFNDINLAVDWVLKNLPADYVIRPFLLKHQSEVKGMIDTEYDEQEAMEGFKKEGYDAGMREGIEQEKVNTEHEKARADEAEQRADNAEQRADNAEQLAKSLKEEVELLKKKISELEGKIS